MANKQHKISELIKNVKNTRTNSDGGEQMDNQAHSEYGHLSIEFKSRRRERQRCPR